MKFLSWSAATERMTEYYAQGKGNRYQMFKRWWGYEILPIPHIEYVINHTERASVSDLQEMAHNLRAMRDKIDARLKQLESGMTTEEAAFNHGRELFQKGVGLSNVWGDCKEEHFILIGRVLDGWESAAREK